MDKEVRPQDTPAICEYSGLRPVEGYKEEDVVPSLSDEEIMKMNLDEWERLEETDERDTDFMYKWIRSKSGK